MGEITPTIGIIIAVILALLNELQCNNAFIHVKTTPTIQVRRLMLVSAGARSRKQLTPASIALNAHNVYSKDESPVETTVREAAALVPPGPMQLHMIMNRKSAGAGLNHVNGTQAASKLRQLKDRMWVRETMEDITAAEFAARLGCHRDIDGVEETRQQMGRTINAVDDGVLREVESNVGASVASASSVSPAGGGLFNKRKRAVDFENLLHKLNRRVQEMCVEGELSSIDDVGNSEGAKCYTLDEMRDDAHSVGTGELCYTLVVDKGMGSVVYSPEQRKALLLKMLHSRRKLVAAMSKAVAPINSTDVGLKETTFSKDLISVKRKSAAASLDADLENILRQLSNSERNGNISTEVEMIGSRAAEAEALLVNGNGRREATSPQLYIREDGTVDWEGALQDRAALRLFGSEVWARINGEEPSSLDNAKNEATIKDEGGRTGGRKAIIAKIIETDAILRKKETLRKLKQELSDLSVKYNELLESGISEGAAVANINFASLDPTLRSSIRNTTLALERKEEEVAYQTLVYELERIFVYLDGEMGNTLGGYIPLQDRLNVAEFGLLESQIDNLSRQLSDGSDIDADILAVIVDQLNDFKRRLGIDYALTGLTFDTEGIRNWLKDVWIQTKKGVAFYGKGCQLFWSDVVFSTNLLGRALQGYTLKPREVRTLRRTFKDVLTFIPFVIILLIPLSPIGHVLVFGAIQRFFPDFFPSCFTERRQNLLQLYESTEYSEILLKESFKGKIVRLSEALVYAVVKLLRKIYAKVNGSSRSSLDGEQ